MARYTGPATRVSRRLRVDLVGGDMAFERRPYPPGQAGRNRIKESEYLLQLQEKQKAKYTYGVWSVSSVATTQRLTASRERPAITWLSCSSPAWTT